MEFTYLIAADGDPIEPQDVGVDGVALTQGLAEAAGVVVAVILASYAAFLLVRKCMRWMRATLDAPPTESDSPRHRNLHGTLTHDVGDRWWRPGRFDR